MIALKVLGTLQTLLLEICLLPRLCQRPELLSANDYSGQIGELSKGLNHRNARRVKCSLI
jgi:hypothetical protein